MDTFKLKKLLNWWILEHSHHKQLFFGTYQNKIKGGKKEIYLMANLAISLV